VPESVPACGGVAVGSQEVGAVGHDGEEEAMGDAVVQEGSHTCQKGGRSCDEGQDGMGQQEALPAVVG